MTNRWIAVALGAVALAVPGTALAKSDHAKKDKASEKRHKHGDKHGHKHESKPKKGKTYIFKGVYKGDGVVTVAEGNSRVRKGGYVGQDVTFDLSAAKLVVADTDGVPGITAADVQAGDVVLVQARLPRGAKAPAPVADEPAATESTDDPVAEETPASDAIKARKLVDKTHPPVKDADDEGEPAEAPHSE
jgi:hypothetical protein